MNELPIYLDDTPSLDISEFKSKARRLKIQKDVRLIIVDFLQLMKSIIHEHNREQEISHISRNLKATAKELGIPIIALASLSRNCENRQDKRPQLSDLRESGSIESDADVVIFLYRDEYYKITTDHEGFPTQGVLEAGVAKHRNGPLGQAKLKFIGKTTSIRDF
jgi:replicative DNA helicase